jgi:hypothetical protein
MKTVENLCIELGIKKFSFFPSPKNQNPLNIIELQKNSEYMLKIYKRHLEGDKTAPIREVFL